MQFIDLKAQQKLIREKIDKRIKDCLISYNQFKNEYPKSKFKNESKKMYNNLKNIK